MFMVNTRVDVVRHLEERMRRWLVVRMGQVVTQPNLTETHLWMVARRIVASLVWEEKKEGARALAAGRPWPRPPPYNEPETIDDMMDMLGTHVLARIPLLTQHSRNEIWRLFKHTLIPNIGGALPFCPTNYGRGAESDK
jgi:hypothetical protein